MKYLLHKIKDNRHFLLFILFFAYAHSIFLRILVRNEINAYTFTPDGAVWTLFKVAALYLIMLLYIHKWQKTEGFSGKELVKIFFASMITLLPTMLLIGLCISFLFDTIEQNFNQETLLISLFTDFLEGLMYGSFFMAFYYFKKNRKYQQELSTYLQALSESRIYHLKTQLNPHFLFNNLNVLDQLIEEDKDKASEFLNEFADIYRYVLQATEKKLISLRQEFEFAEQYFKLIQHKYGNAYQLFIEEKPKEGFIVPLTLQLLLENAVQHNLGTAENPVCITIHLTDQICFSNDLKLKRSPKLRSGRSLNNLKDQYTLLTEKSIDIRQSDSAFSVSIPIIPTQVL